MFGILDHLDRIEKRLDAIEYRGGNVVREKINVFDINLFLPFRVTKRYDEQK
jgi:hypothetical protein